MEPMHAWILNGAGIISLFGWFHVDHVESRSEAFIRMCEMNGHIQAQFLQSHLCASIWQISQEIAYLPAQPIRIRRFFPDLHFGSCDLSSLYKIIAENCLINDKITGLYEYRTKEGTMACMRTLPPCLSRWSRARHPFPESTSREKKQAHKDRFARLMPSFAPLGTTSWVSKYCWIDEQNQKKYDLGRTCAACVLIRSWRRL